MKGTVHLVALSVACLVSGCTSTVDIGFEDRNTLSHYSTWDWRPDAMPTVEADPFDERPLRAQLNQLIEQALQGRGFERAHHHADIFLTYHLARRRRVEVVNVPMAPYYLSSHHGSASYWIEGTNKERRVYWELRLAIVVTQADGRTLWQASLERRANESSRIPLEEVVAALIEQLPGSRLQVE